MNCYTLLFELLFYSFHLGLFAEESWSKQPIQCSEQYLSQFNGVISSPNYPSPLKQVYCNVWKIPLPPGTFLKIHLTDLDIAEDFNCRKPDSVERIFCCRRNRLMLPGNSNNSLPHILCGSDGSYPRTITVTQSPANITYVYSNPTPGARGFSLNYMTEYVSNCGEDRFECYNGTCLPSSQRCDLIKQCPDGEDELNCPSHNLCPKGEIACSYRSKYCYKPEERCDGNFQCLFGEDEVGCVPDCDESRISCSNGEGCYAPSQRCDSRSDCADESDEAGCPTELCVRMLDKRQCRNSRCIAARLWCDGSDDCGDSSDEESCLQNSVITATMMAALVGGLLLVLAVGYTIRYYGQRPPIVHSHLASQLRLRHSVSLPAHIDDEFLARERPPAYSVAVADVCRLPAASQGGRRAGRLPVAGRRPLLSVRRLAAKPSSPVHSEASSAPGSGETETQAGDSHLMSGSIPASTNNYCSDDTVQLIGA